MFLSKRSKPLTAVKTLTRKESTERGHHAINQAGLIPCCCSGVKADPVLRGCHHLGKSTHRLLIDKNSSLTRA